MSPDSFKTLSSGRSLFSLSVRYPISSLRSVGPIRAHLHHLSILDNMLFLCFLKYAISASLVATDRLYLGGLSLHACSCTLSPGSAVLSKRASVLPGFSDGTSSEPCMLSLMSSRQPTGSTRREQYIRLEQGFALRLLCVSPVPFQPLLLFTTEPLLHPFSYQFHPLPADQFLSFSRLQLTAGRVAASR